MVAELLFTIYSIYEDTYGIMTGVNGIKEMHTVDSSKGYCCTLMAQSEVTVLDGM